MVVIRLSRTGSKKRPFYYVVATDKRSRRDGGYIENLGFFNPMGEAQSELKLNLERIRYWQSVGASLSERVSTLVDTWVKQHGAAAAA